MFRSLALTLPLVEIAEELMENRHRPETPEIWLPTGRQLLVIVVCGIAAITLFFSVYKTIFYRAAIPAEIGLAFGFASTGSSSSLWDLLAPGRHEACGGAIFELSDTMLDAIRERGIDAVKDARQGRGYADSRDRSFHYYSYKQWQPTPLPAEWTSQGLWYGLSCMNLARSLAKNILEAAHASGSFYTTGRSTMLFVSPSLKIAILTYTN